MNCLAVQLGELWNELAKVAAVGVELLALRHRIEDPEVRGGVGARACHPLPVRGVAGGVRSSCQQNSRQPSSDRKIPTSGVDSCGKRRRSSCQTRNGLISPKRRWGKAWRCLPPRARPARCRTPAPALPRVIKPAVRRLAWKLAALIPSPAAHALMFPSNERSGPP
jgi:hypothetical protein